jgi:hypothetical protein
VKFGPYHSRVKSTWIYRSKTEIKRGKLITTDAIPFTKDPNANNSNSSTNTALNCHRISEILSK